MKKFLRKFKKPFIIAGIVISTVASIIIGVLIGRGFKKEGSETISKKIKAQIKENKNLSTTNDEFLEDNPELKRTK